MPVNDKQISRSLFITLPSADNTTEIYQELATSTCQTTRQMAPLTIALLMYLAGLMCRASLVMVNGEPSELGVRCLQGLT